MTQHACIEMRFTDEAVAVVEAIDIFLRNPNTDWIAAALPGETLVIHRSGTHIRTNLSATTCQRRLDGKQLGLGE